jgi:hypothetical protein
VCGYATGALIRTAMGYLDLGTEKSRKRSGSRAN